jgi:hypothetical protein
MVRVGNWGAGHWFRHLVSLQPIPFYVIPFWAAMLTYYYRAVL